jgi:hypothetical protein
MCDYRFHDSHGTESDYGFELLLEAQSADLDNRIPVNIRLTYRSSSGIKYTAYPLFVTPWLTETVQYKAMSEAERAH